MQKYIKKASHWRSSEEGTGQVEALYPAFRSNKATMEMKETKESQKDKENWKKMIIFEDVSRFC